MARKYNRPASTPPANRPNTTTIHIGNGCAGCCLRIECMQPLLAGSLLTGNESASKSSNVSSFFGSGLDSASDFGLPALLGDPTCDLPVAAPFDLAAVCAAEPSPFLMPEDWPGLAADFDASLPAFESVETVFCGPERDTPAPAILLRSARASNPR